MKKFLALFLAFAMVFSSVAALADINVDADTIEVSTAEELTTVAGSVYGAEYAGKTIVLMNDITVTAEQSTNYGKTGLNILYGQTLDGNGHTLTVNTNGTWDSAINTTGGTIKNLTINNGFRGIFINHNSEYRAPVVLENVTIDGTTYTISCDQGTNNGLTATNCTFNGWTSYAETLGDVEFINCNFGEGNGYKYCRPYASTTFFGCNFDGGYELDDTKTDSTLVACTYDGEILTSENITDLLGGADATGVTVNEEAVAYIPGKGGYDELSAAIAAATAGDTITLLADVTENVKVGKSITIDGADKNYTGTMTISDSINLTIDNVNFVGGNVVKGKSTGTSGTYIIKNCNFDSDSDDVYAIELRGTGRINIENCTSEGYFGFLQVPSSNNSVSIKNVTIDGTDYAIKVDYSNGVSLEDVTIKNSTYGFVNSNFGTKTINVKNCNIKATYPLVIWDRDKQLFNTFKFEGDNDFGSNGFYYQTVTEEEMRYTKYVLTENATLTAVEGLNVTSDKGYYVMYANGTYSIERVAEINGVKYPSLQDAINAAVDGDTITLIADIKNAEKVTIDNKKVVIDLNEHTFNGAILPSTGDITVKNGSIVNTDSSVSGIEVNSGNLTLTNVNIDSARHAVRIDGAVTATINGGTYKVGGTANATQYAVNVSGAATVTINGGTFTGPKGTASDSGAAVKVQTGSNVTINGGTFTGGKNNTLSAEGILTVYGGSFDQKPTDYLADGYEIVTDTYGMFKVVGAAVPSKTVAIKFVKEDKDAADNDTAEGEDTYLIQVVGDEDEINRLNSADLTFLFTSTPVTGAEMDYELIEVDNISITPSINPENNEIEKDRYMFNFDFKSDTVTGTGDVITIGKVKVTGYGKYSFVVNAAATTNEVHATTKQDNVVDTYVPGGAVGKGVLDISDEEMTEITIAVPTRELKIQIAFPNALALDNKIAYQDMKVEISGNIDGVQKTVVYKLGKGEDTEDYKVVEMTNKGYVVTNNDLVLNEAYNVTVSGAGYRTARYTVTMTEDKTLNFWNNVKDNDTVVEVGKDSSKAKVTFLAGDIVKDNNINIYDLSAVVSYFGANNNVEEASTYAKYDLNRDGKIDSKDVAYVLVSWGK